MTLTWVNTTGGPHLVVSEKYAAAWEGCFAPSGGRGVQAVFRYDPSGPATDYDRACDVPGWLGVLPVGEGEALVLGGEPTQAALYQAGGEQRILRWLWGESEAGLLEHFHAVREGLPVVEEEAFHHPGGKLFLMDSTDRPGGWLGERAEFALPAGRYRVDTLHSETEETSFVAHRLRREDGD